MIDGATPQQTLGSYRLEEELGSGSTGVVWRARRDGPVRQVVALKRLRPGVSEREVARLRDEANVLTQLDHPHIVRVLEVVDDDGLVVAMQFAPGGSLADVLSERGRLPAHEVVALAAPVADALASAHRRRILHCDVKPANILFTSDGEPLLSDFGVARHLAAGGTADQPVAGTAEYLAPELLDGGHPDVRSDVYSLGVVCYEALAGRRPFTASTPLAVVRAADEGRHQPLTAVPDVPRALARVVERAMARRPADRHSGAAELAGDLRASLGGATAHLPDVAGPRGRGRVAGPETASFGPRPPRPAPPPAPVRHRTRLLILGGLVAGLALTAVAVGPLHGTIFGDGDPPRADGAACPTLPSPELPAGAVLLQGDLDGDGCATHVIRRGDEVEAVVDAAEREPRRFRLGQPDDVLLLGDWDCDGSDTPGLYRPADGRVFYFFEWARPGAALPTAEAVETNRAGATPEVRDAPEVRDDGANGCQEIVLRGGDAGAPDPPASGMTSTDEA